MQIEEVGNELREGQSSFDERQRERWSKNMMNWKLAVREWPVGNVRRLDEIWHLGNISLSSRFFFLQAHSDTSRCWWMWIQTFLQHNFMLFFIVLRSSKVEIYIISWGGNSSWKRGVEQQSKKKSFHHLMNFKSHLKLSVNLSNNLNNSSHSLTELVGWVGKLETRQENLRF